MSPDPSAVVNAAIAARELERADQQAILDNLPALIAYWDRDLRNRLANHAYVDYFGLTPEQIFGRHISEVLGPELFAKNWPFLERALAGERQEFDREIPTPSGPRYTQALYLPDIRDGEVRGIFVLVTDITARRQAEVALAHAEARFRTLFEAAPSATLLSDTSGQIVAANQAAARLFGYSVAELVGMNGARLLYDEDLDAAQSLREQLLGRETTKVSQERRYLHALGHTIWAQAELTLIPGSADDDQSYVLAQLQDISARKSYEKELEHLADHDALTGLLNRRGLAVELERQAALARRYGSGGVLLLFDLDHFKTVNDTLGHASGDELIDRVAQLLSTHVRETDVVARLGGDEFAVILPQDSLTTGTQVAQKLIGLLREELNQNAWRALPVTASVGIAEFTGDLSADQVLVNADLAMYDAKEAGRNQVAPYRRNGFRRPKIESRINWVQRIRGALDAGQVVIAHQPIRNTTSNTTQLSELLVRVRDDNGELALPAAFLYIAEQFDLVQELDRQVIAKAAAYLATIPVIARPHVSINLSAKTVSQSDLADYIQATFALWAIDPQLVTFEITETAAATHMHDARTFAHAVKALGCGLAIDDFGAGFGSFYYLTTIPFDFLKIDGNFVTNALTSQPHALIVTTVRDLARGLGGDVIAEYCATPEIGRWLDSQDIHLQQGYLHGHPQLCPTP